MITFFTCCHYSSTPRCCQPIYSISNHIYLSMLRYLSSLMSLFFSLSEWMQILIDQWQHLTNIHWQFQHYSIKIDLVGCNPVWWSPIHVQLAPPGKYNKKNSDMSPACEKRWLYLLKKDCYCFPPVKNLGGSPKIRNGVINWHPCNKYWKQFCWSPLKWLGRLGL